jgi:hypothetical protein
MILRHASDYLPKVLEQQPENGLALGSGPAETLRRIMEDGAGGAAFEAASGTVIEIVGGDFHTSTRTTRCLRPIAAVL